MPQGLKWSPTEAAELARAWANASNNAIRGADQRHDEFWDDVLAKMKLVRPTIPAEQNGRFWQRGREAIHAYWRDHLSKDVMSFNKALRKVFEAEPTGVTLQEMICMAVAIHLKKTKHMDYHFKNFDVTKWRFYSAWHQLKNVNKFRYAGPVPEGVQEAAEQEGIVGDAAAEEVEADGGQQANLAASAAQRGGGVGQKKAKRRKKDNNDDGDNKDPREELITKFTEEAASLRSSINSLVQERKRSTNILLDAQALELFQDDDEVQERVRSRIRQQVMEEVDDQATHNSNEQEEDDDNVNGGDEMEREVGGKEMAHEERNEENIENNAK